MLYDNGGAGVPRPMPQMPMPTPQRPQPVAPPKLTGNRMLDEYNLGIFGKDFPINQFLGRQRQMGMARAPQQQPMAPRPQYQMTSPAMGQPQNMRMPMGYQRRSPGANFDINGRPIGAWDYRPPQQYGNPFMPMVPF